MDQICQKIYPTTVNGSPGSTFALFKAKSYQSDHPPRGRSHNHTLKLTKVNVLFKTSCALLNGQGYLDDRATLGAIVYLQTLAIGRQHEVNLVVWHCRS
jgi:hypothetical protein